MSEKLYITTPLYYVNDEPHIGHAYTTILADVLARYHRMFGRRVYFLTGTDEHGQKVASSALAAGVSEQEHVDLLVSRFKEVWRELGISYDVFFRTTEEYHKRAVTDLLQELFDRGEIYKDTYEGWYCVHEERFWTEKDLVEGNCPDCGRPVERLSEDNYYFRMSAHQQWLIEYVESHPEFVRPDVRRNEVLGFLRQPLGDLCISRPKSRLSWGITLPFDEDYVTYVWFDALLNYVNAVGFRTDEKRFAEWWPAEYHLIGKDILTTHAVYWPIMLHAAGVAPPKTVFAHGWWLSGETKMSKSRGNVVRPLDLAREHGADPFRYFLIREMTLGRDATFTPEVFVERLNGDLSNDLGNLVSRVTKLITTGCDGVIPPAGGLSDDDARLRDEALSLAGAVREAVEEMKPNAALEAIGNVIRSTNRYVEQQAPWNLAKTGQTERLRTVLRTAAEVLRVVGTLLWPVMPDKCARLLGCLGVNTTDPTARFIAASEWDGLTTGASVHKETLFPRMAKMTEDKKDTTEPATAEGVVSFDAFGKLDMRVALVVEAESVPNADKLVKMQIDMGELGARQIVAGIAKWHSPESLVNRRIVVVANLEPARIRGVASEGMLLAATHGDDLALVTIDGDLPPGSRIS